MAVADTARLIASLELQDKFSGPAKDAERRLSGMERAMAQTQRKAGIMSGAVSTALGIGLAKAVSTGVSLVTSAVKGGVASLNELESVTVATATVLESTNGVAGQTAEGIRALAEEYESLNATMDDKVIQSGANLLLTFTNIREQAFEPALEAALNMNQAMGGGPEGLQTAIIQVGKALNDPIKGIGALRKVGVQLTAQQEEQIRALVAANDLYGAQSIILGELSTQFGSQFAAAGDTAAGKQAAFNDKIEDLQVALAGPLIPTIDRVRDKLIEMMGSPTAIAAAERLGQAIDSLVSEENLDRAFSVLEEGLDTLAGLDISGVGEGIEDVFGFLGSVPWGTIADGLKITGQAAKVAVDAFLALPPEVQGIAISALAINKLTGGLAGSLVGGAIKGGAGAAIGALRGSTPATPLFVKDVGLPGGGAGGPVPGGGGLAGRLAGGLAIAGGVGLAATAGVMTVEFVGNAQQLVTDLNTRVDELPRRTGAEIDASISKVEAALAAANDGPLSSIVSNTTGLTGRLESELSELRGQRSILERGANAARDAVPWAQRIAAETGETSRRTGAALDAVRATAANTSAIAAKPDPVFNPEINVHTSVTANVSIHEQQRVLTSAQRAYSDTHLIPQVN